MRTAAQFLERRGNVASLPAAKKPENDSFDAAVKAAATEAQEARKTDGATALDAKIAELNEQHFVSTEGGKARIFQEGHDYELNRPLLVPQTPSDFRTLYCNQLVRMEDNSGNTRTKPLADVWLGHQNRRQYLKGMALLPAGNAPDGVYNLWRGWGVTPEEGDVTPALWHLEYVACGGNKALFDYVVGWLARSVQTPEKQAETALILQGAEGTGKGTLGRWMLRIFGMHGLHVLQRKHLVGNFNGHMRLLCFVFVDEALFVGDREGQNVLKGLITEDTFAVEKKGIDAYEIRNRLKVLMATNEDWVVQASEDARRYCVIRVSDRVKGDLGYFNKLEAHMQNGGLAAFLHHLLHYDLSNFNIRSIPNTEALEAQKLRSMSPFMAWLYQRLCDGRLCQFDSEWVQEQRREAVVADFREYVKERNLRYVATDNSALGKDLREIFPLEVKRESAGKRPWLWIMPTLAQARRAFENRMKLEHHEWPEG